MVVNSLCFECEKHHGVAYVLVCACVSLSKIEKDGALYKSVSISTHTHTHTQVLFEM